MTAPKTPSPIEDKRFNLIEAIHLSALGPNMVFTPDHDGGANEQVYGGQLFVNGVAVTEYTHAQLLSKWRLQVGDMPFIAALEAYVLIGEVGGIYHPTTGLSYSVDWALTEHLKKLSNPFTRWDWSVT